MDNKQPPAKLLEFHGRAKSEYGHPDPDRAIFGRASLSGFDSDYDQGGRAGLFAVSKKKAKSIGYGDLSYDEESFRAAMELDMSVYEAGGIDEMFAKTAGVSSGVGNRNKYIADLDDAADMTQEKIVYEDGSPIAFSKSDILEPDPSFEAEGDEEVRDATKRHSAKLQENVMIDQLGVVRSLDDVKGALQLLRTYIDKAV